MKSEDNAEIKDAKDALIELGWSEYESKTYAALVLQGVSTASQIAKVSQVPPNRVYQILEKLSEKGYVRRKMVDRGGPSNYIAPNPQELLDELRIQYETKVEKAKNALKELTERNQDEVTLTTHTIFGRRELNVHINDFIVNVKNELLIGIDTLLEIKKGGLTDYLLELNKREEFELKILTTTRGVNDPYEIEILDKLKGLQIRVAQDHFPTLLFIADEARVIFTNYGLKDEKEEKNYLGVYYSDKDTAKMFRRMFLLSWEDGTEPNFDED